MRSLPWCLALSGLGLLLTGCGDDSSDSAFNPADDVDLVFSTFDLVDQEGQPPTLEHTRFHDFYRGIEPLDGSDTDAADTAAELRGLIDQVMGAVASASGDHYRKVRNPLDLMNQVLASGEVSNFATGRGYISERIAAGEPGTYNSRANGALIRFIDQAATNAGASRPDREWLYHTLAWTYAPDDPDGNAGYEKVFRTIQYVSRDDEGAEPDTLPELFSLLAGSQFDANNFVVQGYNPPEYANVSFATRTLGSIEFRQEIIGQQTDTLFVSRSDEDASPDCLRAELDYPMATLRVYTSTDEPAQIEQDGAFLDNPQHCAFQQPGDEHSRYDTVAIAERQ
ncbi:hypothetical protein [Marinobacter sp. SS21]|uniref:hypothetical protein n=1 Tax=Marinobacter sp. SS21 TaxID=2979460 RepID=UPI00232C2D58|nr:hypothetical protein [Marinobacter sp. SS21]MDC0661054.1 hypothetical protein [Marinobacter sp. SS21]